jgi:hypothetical protein
MGLFARNPRQNGLCGIHPGTFAPIPEEAVATMFPILPSAGIVVER